MTNSADHSARMAGGGNTLPPGRVLINLSGGIDSTYCLWKALQSGREVLVHHIRLTNNEGRMQYERRSVVSVLDWLRRNKLTNFTYMESAFDYGTIKYVVRDAKLWSFLSAVILLNPKNSDVNEVIIPSHLDSPIMENDSLKSEIVNIIGAAIAGKRDMPEITYPIGRMLKKEVVLGMPPDLLAMCWWCRKPVDKKPCGKCHSCKRYERSFIEEIPATGAIMNGGPEPEQANSGNIVG